MGARPGLIVGILVPTLSPQREECNSTPQYHAHYDQQDTTIHTYKKLQYPPSNSTCTALGQQIRDTYFYLFCAGLCVI